MRWGIFLLFLAAPARAVPYCVLSATSTGNVCDSINIPVPTTFSSDGTTNVIIGPNTSVSSEVAKAIRAGLTTPIFVSSAVAPTEYLLRITTGSDPNGLLWFGVFGDGRVIIASTTVAQFLTISSAAYFQSQTSTATQARLGYVGGTLTLNQNAASGLFKFMDQASNPQITMGSASMSGSGFIDTQNGSTLYLNALAANRTVTIGSGGLRTDSPAGDLATAALRFKIGYFTALNVSSMTVSGAGAPPAGFALCYDANGRQGHCTTVNALTGACTCSVP